MNIKINPNYLVITAETMEDAAKLGIVSTLLKLEGYNHAYMAFTTLEIPLMKNTKAKK